jgi:hypothetical protein
MAVFSKKYDKRGRIDAEDYIVFMCEAIEFFASTVNKRTLALEERCARLEKENEALKQLIKKQEASK